MSPVRRIVAVAGILATAGFGSFAAVSIASATTGACASSPWCFTQEVTSTANSSELVMAVPGQHGYSNTPVVVEHQSSHDSRSDFLAGLAPFPVTRNAKIFEYAPHGHLSQLCVTETSYHPLLILRPCDGSPNQAWDAVPSGSGYEWYNEASGDVMTDGSHPSNYQIGPAGSQLSGQHAEGKKNQVWTAVQ
jgi:hypothetical protein